MTIRIWNAPRGSECYCPVFSHVSAVKSTKIIFDDGTEVRKPLMSKVEVLGDDNYEIDFEHWYHRVGKGSTQEWRDLPFPSEL